MDKLILNCIYTPPLLVIEQQAKKRFKEILMPGLSRRNSSLKGKEISNEVFEEMKS